MAPRSTATDLRLLLRILDEAFQQKAWHGPNLKGSLRGVTARQAAWRPSPGRHNIAELVRHAAYWKYAVRRRLVGEKRGGFPAHGSNWFATASPSSPGEWKKELALLNEMHNALLSAVAKLHGQAVKSIERDRRLDVERLLYGIALHDVYHAGQVQLLKRLSRKA